MIRYAIVLIAGNAPGQLTPGLVHDLYFSLVPPLYRTSLRWLADGEAVDLGIVVSAPHEAETLAEVVGDHIDRLPVDVALVAEHGRRKRLLVADMDSTVIGQECIDELAELAGLRPRIAAITERAMRGEIAFEAALTERVALLAGLEEGAIAKILRERISLTPGAKTLTATMHAHGGRSVLVSGGFTVFTGAVAQRAGFDDHRANRLEIAGGRLTGRVLPPILGRDAKRQALLEAAQSLGVGPEAAIAVGDGANDLAMIKAAGLGVGFRAKPALAAQTPVNIRHADLTALLYLQGYARPEFAGSSGSR